MIDLNNKIIIIFGSEGKIGSDLIKKISKFNCIIYACDNSFKKKLNVFKFNNAKKIEYKFDITKENNFNSLLRHTIKKNHKIDAIVHCAYPRTNKWGVKIEDTNFKDLKKNIDMQLSSTVLMSKIFFNYFKKIKKGKIILFSSIYGVILPDFEIYDSEYISPIEYSIIKSGIITLVKYLAKYSKNLNINVNCISPGGIKDSSQGRIFKRKYKNLSLNKGLLDPTDITDTVLFLLSDSSKYINGQNIVIDDGRSL